MKILIIGGTGNISRWLTRLLAERGDDVTLFHRSVNKVEWPGKVRSVYGDRTDLPAFENAMAGAGFFDCVIDMVGYAPDDARSAIRCFAGRTGQYIFCSTVDVYSKKQFSYPVALSQKRGALPSFPYAYKKMIMEELFEESEKRDGLPLTILRPGATYSEGWSPLVTAFGGQLYHLRRLWEGAPVVLHGDGSAIWTCSHSEDVAAAFAAAAGNPATIGQSYNITGDELMSWRSMHETVASLLGGPAPDFVFIPTTELGRLCPVEAEWCVENFQFNNIFDNRKAKEELGYRYRIGFGEGARRCIDDLLGKGLIESADSPPFYQELLDEWRCLKQA